MLLSLKDINVYYDKKTPVFGAEQKMHALKEVNMDVEKGEIITIVGESGCGKTTMGKVITGLLKPTSGKLVYNDINVYSCMPWDYKKYRSAVQFVQQDSYAALNPARTIYQSLYAPLRKLYGYRRDLPRKVDELMQMVELTPPEQFLKKYPHQLSGGQRQRVLLARALSMNPELIVADEPISMIDVSLRFAMLNLFAKLNRERGITIIYITHDLSTARCVAANGRMYVMYFGECVESGRTTEILSNPRHPYTQALLAAVPIPDPHIEKNKTDPPLKTVEAAHDGKGCGFKQRCLYADEKCMNEKIEYKKYEDRFVLCRKCEELPSWKIENLTK